MSVPMRDPVRAHRRRGAALRGLVLALAVASPGLADTVILRNGGVIKCKVVKETKDLVKVRMPHRGRIVTTFLNRGAIDSIDRLSDAENRQFFQGLGVRNPAKTFEPVYYSGGRTAAAGGKAKAAGKTGAKTKERGIEARRKASEARAKAKSDKSKSSASAAASSPSAGTADSAVSAITTAGSTTTR